ncbi:hypothetical protein SUGI_0937140 [Cryptomeria japonica]|nr:hypothetical protein SUGI_0937140 [Cryptomeria japonica]
MKEYGRFLRCKNYFGPFEWKSKAATPHLAANHNLVSPGEMKELGRLRAAFMREKCEEVVFCPKPRRSGLVMHQIPEFSKQTRRHRNHPPEHNDSEAGVEILDIFLSKSGCTDALTFGCSPPYFNGSPPSRADNPLIHDVKFIHQSDVKFLHQRVQASPSTLSKPKSFGRSSFGPNATVRVEGFDCSGRDTRCSIPALA